MKKVLFGLLVVTAVISLIANVLLYSRYSTSRAIVIVGGEKVTKKEYLDNLEYRHGKQILTKIVYEKMVRQAAKKAGVEPTEKAIKARIAQIERRNPEMLSGVDRDPVKINEFKQALALDMMMEELRVQGVRVSDSQVADLYQRRKTLFALPAQASTSIVVTKSDVDAASARELLRQKMPLDTIARQPRLQVVGVNGYNPDWRFLPTDARQKLSAAVFQMRPGEVRTVALRDKVDGNNFFFTLLLGKKRTAGVQPFAAAREQARQLAQLQKAPSSREKMAELYKKANVTFEVDRYASYFDDIKKAGEQVGARRTASMR